MSIMFAFRTTQLDSNRIRERSTWVRVKSLIMEYALERECERKKKSELHAECNLNEKRKKESDDTELMMFYISPPSLLPHIALLVIFNYKVS